MAVSKFMNLLITNSFQTLLKKPIKTIRWVYVKAICLKLSLKKHIILLASLYFIGMIEKLSFII